MTTLTLALSKGRILEETMPLLQAIGLEPAGDIDRLLRVPSRDPDVQHLIVRPSDVPTYVEYGAADFGIVGKDILMEHGGGSLYEPLDLGISKCRLMVAGLPGSRLDGERRPRVATKYPEITRRHFAQKGQQVEIIKLYGSMELAPLVQLADVIVDLVATGKTLKANGLVELEPVCDISSRLVVNRAAMKTKHAALKRWLNRFREAAAHA